jgi:hypothetical protein
MNKFDEIICSSHIISHIHQLKTYYPELIIPSELHSLDYPTLEKLHIDIRLKVKAINAEQKLSHLFKIMIVCIERVYVVIMKNKSKLSMIQNIKLVDTENIKSVGSSIVQQFRSDLNVFNLAQSQKLKMMVVLDKFSRILEGSDENLDDRECDIFMEGC